MIDTVREEQVQVTRESVLIHQNRIIVIRRAAAENDGLADAVVIWVRVSSYIACHMPHATASCARGATCHVPRATCHVPRQRRRHLHARKLVTCKLIFSSFTGKDLKGL